MADLAVPLSLATSPFLGEQAKRGVLQTEAAVERFNEVRAIMPVGGLFHSTC